MPSHSRPASAPPRDFAHASPPSVCRPSPPCPRVSGRNFGSYVTHETKNFIYFYLGQVAILLFKSG